MLKRVALCVVALLRDLRLRPRTGIGVVRNHWSGTRHQQGRRARRHGHRHQSRNQRPACHPVGRRRPILGAQPSPATYSLKIELSGFQTAEVKDLVLRNGEVARPTITLGLASLAETVTVRRSRRCCRATNASVSQTHQRKAD